MWPMLIEKRAASWNARRMGITLHRRSIWNNTALRSEDCCIMPQFVATGSGAHMGKNTFGKEGRLVSNRQFKRVLAHRVSARDGLLAVYMAPNTSDVPRLGVSVGKSCGNAVARNRFKRLIREAFRLSRPEIPVAFDYVVMVSPQWAQRLDGQKGKVASTAIGLDCVRSSFESLVRTAYRRTGRI